MKVVRDAPDSLAAQRLRREASITASVTHPGVVGVRGVGDEQDRTFMVLDLLPGGDLASVLAKAVHRAGVVHGDVKPANVMVYGEHATLTDFGIATDPSGWGHRTRYGTTASTAPEQVRGEPPSSSADMYALGCLIFIAITGRHMFPQVSPSVVLHHHAHITPPRLSEMVLGVPPRLDALVASLLTKEPADRPSAADVSETLTALLNATEVRLQSAPLSSTQVIALPQLDPAGTQPMLTVATEGFQNAA